MVSLLLLQTSRSGGTGCGQQSDLRSASLWPGLGLCAGELLPLIPANKGSLFLLWIHSGKAGLSVCQGQCVCDST
jgi:hypothetical protein